MATYVPPKRGVELILYVGLVSQASRPQLQANPTLAAGDVQISKDGGAFANLTTLPVVTPASGRAVKVTVSATEMTADNVVIQFVDAAGAEWDDLFIGIATAARQLDDLAFPNVSGRGIDVSTTGEADANVATWLAVAVNALVGGDVPSNLKQWLGAAPNALLQGRVQSMAGTAVGTADSGTTSTFVDTERTEADTDYWKGAIVLFTSGTLAGQARLITAFNATTDEITFSPATTVAVAAGHTYVLLPQSVVDMRLALAAAIVASSFAVDSIDAAALAVNAGQEIADRVLLRSIASGADGGRSVRSALRKIRNKVSIAAGVLTVTEEDDSTTDHTAAVVTTAGDPVSSVDPV